MRHVERPVERDQGQAPGAGLPSDLRDDRRIQMLRNFDFPVRDKVQLRDIRQTQLHGLKAVSFDAVQQFGARQRCKIRRCNANAHTLAPFRFPLQPLYHPARQKQSRLGGIVQVCGESYSVGNDTRINLMVKIVGEV